MHVAIRTAVMKHRNKVELNRKARKKKIAWLANICFRQRTQFIPAGPPSVPADALAATGSRHRAAATWATKALGNSRSASIHYSEPCKPGNYGGGVVAAPAIDSGLV
jgi:hypothetical protein